MAKDINFLKNLSQRLRELAKSVGGQRELARRAGIDPRRLHASIARHGNPGTDLIAKVYKATGCSVRWLVTGDGEMFDTGHGIGGLPVLAIAAAAQPDGICTLPEHGGEYGDIVKIPADLHLVRIHGDSMVPVAQDGQFVACTRLGTPKDGELALIKHKDGRLIFKRIFFTGDQVLCVNVNPEARFQPFRWKQSEIQWLRKVWGIKF